MTLNEMYECVTVRRSLIVPEGETAHKVYMWATNPYVSFRAN